MFMTSFPIWNTTKEKIIRSTPTYISKHIYNLNNPINKIVDVTKIQWKDNRYIGDIYDKIPKMKYNQQLYCIKYTNITMQTPLYYAQTYQYKHRYN